MSRCLALILVLICLPALAQEPPTPPEKAKQEKLKERDRLFQEAIKLIKSGKQPEAITATEKALTIEREVFQT